MITGKQCRAARALLNITQNELAEAVTNPARSAILTFESEEKASKHTIDTLTNYFESQGIEFSPNHGVSFRPQTKVYRGVRGFRSFMDDVYETAKAGGALALFNTQPQLWIKYLGSDWYDMHNKRMAALGKIDVRIITAEGNKNFILDSAAYHWFPKGRFYSAMFYCYGDKIGFLNFDDDDIEITVIDMQNFANGFRELFESTWKYDSTHARDALI